MSSLYDRLKGKLPRPERRGIESLMLTKAANDIGAAAVLVHDLSQSTASVVRVRAEAAAELRALSERAWALRCELLAVDDRLTKAYARAGESDE